MNSKLKATLLVAAAAVLFSTGGAAIKGCTLNAWQVAGLRSAVASVAILAFLPEARRNWSWSQVPVAAAYAGTLTLFVAANKLTTSANAIFLQDTAPLFVLVMGPLLLKEPVRRSDLVFMAAVACGMALFFLAAEPARATAPNPRAGNLLAAASALTWAFTITGLRWIGRRGEAGANAGMATVALGNILTSAVTLPLAFPMPHIGRNDVLVLAWLGLFQIGLAYVSLVRGVRALTALEATTILLLEPALNPVWAWLVHGERPAKLALAGGAVIIAATLVKARWQSAREQVT